MPTERAQQKHRANSNRPYHHHKLRNVSTPFSAHTPEHTNFAWGSNHLHTMIRSYLTQEPAALQEQENIRFEAARSLQENPVEKPADTPSALTEVLVAPFRGLEGAARNVYGLADYVTGDALPDWDRNFLGTSQTTAGSIVENTSQFLAGFIPVFGALGKVGAVTNVLARGAIAGAVTDFSVFDGQQDRLSNLIQSHPSIANPITEFLAADQNDGEIEGRLKNALEGAGVGVALDGLVAGLKGVAKARGLKAAGASAEEVNKALVEPLGDKTKLDAILDANKKPLDNEALAAAPAAKEEIKTVARADYENGQIDVTKYVDSSDDLKALLTERQAYITNQYGTRPVEKIEETFSRVGSVIAGFSGKSEDAILSTLRSRSASLQESTTFGLAAADLMKATAEEAQKYAKLVSAGDKTNENLLKSLAAQERLAELISITSGYGTLQGRALNARRYIKAAEINSKELAAQLVEQFGGTGYLSKNLEKIASAASAEGVGKLVSNQLTLGNRLLRAHNEYWINAILSGPKTSVVNALGNTFTTLYLPLEGAVGSLFRGDRTAASAFLKQYVYIAESVQEASRFAFQSLRTGEAILDPLSRVSDVVGDRKALSAGYLTQNPALATQGLRAEAKASADALKSLDQTSLYHLLNFTGEVARLPSRFLTGADEFFKQLNYRSSAKTKLYFEGRARGLVGSALADSVTSGIDNVVTKGGEVFSEAGVYRQAMREAGAKGLQGRYKQQFIDQFVEQNWNPANSALAQFADTASFARGVAQEATFTRELGDFGKKVQSLISTHPLLQLVVPFVRTPTNMLKFVGQRTFAFTRLPRELGGLELPVLSSLHRRHVLDMASADPLIRSQAMGRTVMGASLFTTAGLAALSGKITGRGPEDESERKVLQATGWQPYSLVFTAEDGSKNYVSFQRLDPVASFFSIVADWTELAARQDAHYSDALQGVMNSALSSLAANVTNKSYLAGVSQLMDALSQPERFLPRYARKQFASYVPNVVAQIRGSLDGDQALKEVRTYQDALFGRLPGLQSTLEPKRNILGQPVDSALATTPLSPVNPFTMSRDKNDPVFKELASLQHGFQQPSPAYAGAINLLDLRSDKGQTAYDRWLQLHGEVKVGGKTLRQSLERLFTSPYYQKLADQSEAGAFRSPRVAEVERVVGLYRRSAFAQVEREYPQLRQALGAYRQDQLSLRRGKQAQQLAALVNQ